MKACFLFLLFMLIKICFCDDFSIVSGVLDHKPGDVLAAFGDFNADKLIDIFVITNSGRGIDILSAQHTKQYGRRTLLTNESIPVGNTIAGIMLADFDGDVLMDVLVTTKKASIGKPDSVQMCVYWGNGSELDMEDPYKFHGEAFQGEPVLFDFNADMRPDLLTQGADGLTIIWQAVADHKNFTKLNFTKSIDLEVPHSSAFIDLDKDYNADLILTKKNRVFEVFSNNSFNTSTTFSFDVKDVDSIGQSSFADFNQDGYIDHVVPAKEKTPGGDFAYFVYLRDGKNKTQWLKVSKEFGTGFLFASPTPYHLDFPATLRVGDYDMDGYPDLLVTLYSSASSADVPNLFLLRNVPNDKGDGRNFAVQQGVLPSLPNSTLLATFYDYGEDGMPDILVTSLSTDGVPSSILLRNNLALDTCFLKVTVISGLCADDCPKGRKPYGVNVPGPTVYYETTQTNGNPQTSSAGQLSQSAHFALQLPFVNFGLGQTPNFVDKVGVGIPQPQNHSKERKKEWTQIIPNAQLIVNPNPIYEPSNWRLQLFVVPSQQIYLTGIALLCTCVVMALIVAVLLWNEKREDKREKKSESQRFHFDAM